MTRNLFLLIMALTALAPGGSAAEETSKAKWAELLQRRPYPYLLALPESRQTEIEGTYVKTVPAAADRVHCLRCPDYNPEGGVWKLNLDRGVFRIFHPESEWRSIGSYIVAGDRLLFANDPNCIDGLGLYAWRLEQDRLELRVLDDPCAIGLRAANLCQMPWRSCRPPNAEAAVTGHWPKPEGCE